MNNYVFVIKKHLEEVCCIVAATLFLSPAIWIVARELMGY